MTRLGLSIEIQEGMSYADTLAMAQAGERLGFETALLAEHYYPSGLQAQYAGEARARISADAWIYLGALARETARIHLGTLVSPVTFRHPSVLAKMAATLDHVSGGRLELGIGAGWFAGEHAAHGFDFPEPGRRVDMVEEQLEIITGLFSSEGPYTFEGKHYALRDCAFTPRPAPRPTIIVGGSATAERLPRLAARFADEYVITMPTPEQCRAVRERLDRACERIGRNPSDVRLSVFAALCVAPSAAEVHQLVANFEATNPQYARMLPQRDQWIAGTPDQARAKIEALESAGMSRLLASVNSDAHREMLPLLAQR